ncbi:Predicted phosphohydrolase, MPP superfamily [Thalassobacillus cyri]|uniref:Predicted phosphohydrolase, MPP superfamily n=1 Tax=Thalassobacillus cyri TaxID=571932 RepID=A0A1H4CJF1_9BACI|nr:metallophosphoesterase [Thalassobacillus cyri]SEA60561.1 Predicted phosphohydrolase, MPP superfamily [Thalassobacillus cyri]
MIYVYTGLLLLIAAVALLFYMYRKAYTDSLDERIIQLDRFPSSFHGVRIFFISDLHKRVVKRDTLEAITTPVDLVVIGGDLIERGVSMDNVRANIKRLKLLKAPIYFVWGNNDYEGDYHDLDATLLDEGVHVLGNTAVEFTSDAGDTFSLLGVDTYQHHEENSKFAFIDARSECKLLVIHDPAMFHYLPLEQKEKVDLVLSGHTHGGQIRFMGFGLRQRGGMKNIDKTPVFISEGYGTRLIPFRLGTRAECHIIIVNSK